MNAKLKFLIVIPSLSPGRLCWHFKASWQNSDAIVSPVYVFWCSLYHYSGHFAVEFITTVDWRTKTWTVELIKLVTLALEVAVTNQVYFGQRRLISALKCKTLLNIDHTARKTESTVQWNWKQQLVGFFSLMGFQMLIFHSPDSHLSAFMCEIVNTCPSP